MSRSANLPPDDSDEERAASPRADAAIVFALNAEAGGLVDRLSGRIAIQGSGFVANEGGLKGRRIIAVTSGVGPEAAARATIALIAGHRPRWVISSGFAGGLQDGVAQGDLVIPSAVRNLAGNELTIDLTIGPMPLSGSPTIHRGRIVSVNALVCDPGEKRRLGDAHQAVAVDMETFAVADACRQAKVPFFAVRMVSDTVDQALPREIQQFMQQTSFVARAGSVTAALWRRPSIMKDLWKLKEDALMASDQLAKFLEGLVGQLPGRKDED